MGLIRGRGAAVLAVLGVVCSGACPAAQASSGLTGVVTDAYTGLPLGGAAIGVERRRDGQQRRHGPVRARQPRQRRHRHAERAGPAGYEKLAISALALPATGGATQNVAAAPRLVRPPRAARASTSNDDPAPPPAAAAPRPTDNDRATGWSATVAGHTQDDPAQITIALPQAIDARAVRARPDRRLRPRRRRRARRLQRSSPRTDGNTYNLAASGTLDATARGANTTVTPTANTHADPLRPPPGPRAPGRRRAHHRPPRAPGLRRRPQHRAVRHARPPARPRTTSSRSSRCSAAFTGPTRRSPATSGTSTATAAGTRPPTAQRSPTSGSAAGTYHVTVGARDFRGSLGTTSLDLRVIDPNALVEPILQRRPLITFDPVDGIDLPGPDRLLLDLHVHRHARPPQVHRQGDQGAAPDDPHHEEEDRGPRPRLLDDRAAEQDHQAAPQGPQEVGPRLPDGVSGRPAEAPHDHPPLGHLPLAARVDNARRKRRR